MQSSRADAHTTQREHPLDDRPGAREERAARGRRGDRGLSSDHLPVMFTIGDVRRRSMGRIPNDYGKANWRQFREEVSRGWNMRTRLETIADLEDAVEAMTRKIQEAMKVTIPTKKIDPFRSSELPQQVLEEIRERNRLRRRYQRTREAKTRVEMSKANRRIQNSIRQHRNDVYRNRLTKVNVRDGSFWNLTKHLRKQYQPITSLEDENGSIAMEDEEIAAMAARTFDGYHQVPDTDQETVEHVEQVVDLFLLNHPPFPGSAGRL
ncbi:hypothetical protein QE152_g40140 [Popillia japonica]|uniref:Uncharacterized protein n=1 Tax=Popillia japonica TaxID=7064 RepID=A0AAW1HSB7_POPJA